MPFTFSNSTVEAIVPTPTPFVYPKSQHCKYRIYFNNLSPWLSNKTSAAHTVFEQLPVWTGFSSQTGLIICNSSISAHILRLSSQTEKKGLTASSVICDRYRLWLMPINECVYLFVFIYVQQPVTTMTCADSLEVYKTTPVDYSNVFFSEWMSFLTLNQDY